MHQGSSAMTATTAPRAMTQMVYKISRASEWEEWVKPEAYVPWTTGAMVISNSPRGPGGTTCDKWSRVKTIFVGSPRFGADWVRAQMEASGEARNFPSLRRSPMGVVHSVVPIAAGRMSPIFPPEIS